MNTETPYNNLSSRSLASINAEIYVCLQQLNSLVYLRLELDREDTHFHYLVGLCNALKASKEEMIQGLLKQLLFFDEMYGATPRAFFASMYEDLNRQRYSTDPEQWPVAPPFGPIVAPKVHAHKQKWHCVTTTLGTYTIHAYTQRYYFLPWLRRSNAIKELEVLKSKRSTAQIFEQKLRVKLEYYKSSNLRLEKINSILRKELDNPFQVFNCVPAYRQYARAARHYFSDIRRLRPHETLPHIEPFHVKQMPKPGDLRLKDQPVQPVCLFRSFEEHHGVEFNYNSWSTIIDSGRDDSRNMFKRIDRGVLNMPDRLNQQEVLFLPANFDSAIKV